jgi:DNA-binding LacI/PurR family transcriptional regulator
MSIIFHPRHLPELGQVDLMQRLEILRPSWQVADHLRKELMSGTWIGTMPGAPFLAKELGIDRKTVEAALQQLQAEKLLAAQGNGRPRRITLAEGSRAARRMRVAILLGEENDRKRDYMVHLQHLLTENGHGAFFAKSTLLKLGMNVERVARFVDKTEADAWVVCAGSREVLEWFSAQPKPALALFGRARRVPIAAALIDKAAASTEAARELIRLGHRRIVLLSRAPRRRPVPAALEQAFLDELAAHGLPTGGYNLPDWEETIQGFQNRLHSMFLVSPPTAMIVDEVPQFVAAQQFLARKRLRVPEDVSLICPDHDVTFDWCVPSISHIHWDSEPLVRRIARWVTHVSHGKHDRSQYFTPARFVPGGTIGPAMSA